MGPEDRFCEAVRNDLRVPLTLEGPVRTMRGVPVPTLCHVHSFRRTRRDADGLAVVLAGAAARYGGDRRRPVTGGAVRGSSARLVGFRPKGATKKLPLRNDESPRLIPGRLRRVTLAAHPSRLLAPVLAVHGRGPSCLARRRCALEAVEKVVTARQGLFCAIPHDA